MLNIGNFLFSFFFLLFGSVSALIIFPTFYYFKNMTKDQNFVTSGLRMIFLVSKQSFSVLIFIFLSPKISLKAKNRSLPVSEWYFRFRNAFV